MRIEVAIDCADPKGLAAFWSAVLGGGDVKGSGEPYCTFEGEPTLVFQKVPEPKAGKNRLHLDLYGSNDPEAEVARLEALGATRAGGRVEGGPECQYWYVMKDPEGNEFCVCAGPC